MKLPILLLLLLCVVSPAWAESFVVNRPCDVLARVVQEKLPELSVDHLFEAKRGSGEWHYAFWTKAEKTWVEEVRLSLRQKSAYSSEVEVEVFRIEGGLVKTKSRPQPMAAATWTEKIREVLEKR